MITFVTYNDYSNLCATLAASLRAAGHAAQALTLTKHDFKYNDPAIHVTNAEMQKAINKSDIVIIGHSFTFIAQSFKFSSTDVCVLHTGTPYRQSHESMNRIFNPIVKGTLIDSPEFATLGAKNIHYIATAIDTDKINYIRSKNENTVFAHYPSNAKTKGTDKIKEMMQKHDCTFICDETNLPHYENIKRIQECDVYIELFSPMQNGNPYGSFGVTAFEAAAMGKIVITNSLFHNVYEKQYGKAEMIIVNTEKEFHEAIDTLNKCSKSEITMMQDAARKWIFENHNLYRTGKLLNEILDTQ